MNKYIYIECPRCGKRGKLDADGMDRGGSIDPVAFSPPEGFRKVALGPDPGQVFLLCIVCGAAARQGSAVH
jgi:hypothetical protein